MSNEQAIQVTAKLYDTRDYVRRMTTPEDYRKRIDSYQGYIRAAMDRWKLSEIQAMMRLAKAMQNEPIVQAGIFAAYVEMIEQSL